MKDITQEYNNKQEYTSPSLIDIKRIRDRRSSKNADIVIYYTCTLFVIDGKRDFELHESVKIQGDQLSVTNCCEYSNGDTCYEFAVHKKVNGRYYHQKHLTLSLEYSHDQQLPDVTMCFETTTQEIRREKIKGILAS